MSENTGEVVSISDNKQTRTKHGFSIFSCRYGKFIIYQRYVIVFMICVGLMLLSGCRYAFFFYRYMGGTKTNDTSTYLPTINYSGYGQDDQKTAKEYWTDEMVFQVTYAFEVGYALCHIPGGILSDLHGGKHFFSMSVMGSGIFTIILPFALKVTGFREQLLLQFIHGALQGMAVPAAWSILARWVPKFQMTTLTALPYACLNLGYLLSITTASYFVMYMDYWQGTFLKWGILIIIWYGFTWVTIFSRPQVHPWITTKELQLIEADLQNMTPLAIPWKKILKDASIWSIIAVNTGDLLLETVRILTIPDYVESVGGNYLRTGPFLFLAPYILQVVVLIPISRMADQLIGKQSLETVYIRSLYTFIGIVFPSIFLLIGAYSQSNFTVAMICFGIVTILSSFTMAGALVNVMDRTRHYAGFVKGLDNGIPTFLVYSCRLFIMHIKTVPSHPKWINIFWFNLAMGLFSTLVYLKWCKGTKAKWDSIVTQEQLKQSHVKRRKKPFY